MKKIVSSLICILLMCVLFAGCSGFDGPLAIEFSNDSVSVSVGSTSSLSVIYTPTDVENKKLVWSSSDETVATVSDGKVTGVSSGEATITAVTEEGVKATCTVSVKDIGVTKVVLSSKSVGLKEGDKTSLTAKVYPAEATQDVEWSSSDPSVVYVDSDGNINALKGGSSTITATSFDGKEGTCLVKVAEKETTTKKEDTTKVIVVKPDVGGSAYYYENPNYYDSEYIFPSSDYVLLDETDVDGCSKETIQMGINEIYARHGRKFSSSSVSSYFESKSWYSVNPNYSDSMITDIEKKNIDFLAKYR